MADSTTVALKQPSDGNILDNEDDSFEEDVDLQRTPTILKKVSTIMITSTLRWFEDDYIKGDPLGEPGTFGMAFQCRKRVDDSDTQTIFAVKQINKARFYHIEKSARLDILQNMKNEIDVMTALQHENIVQLHDVYEDRNYIYLIMDCLSGGELFGRISDNNDGLTERDAASITKQILDALDYMQQNNICHLDLKPDNIMFESDAEDAKIKLIDFGMAQVVPRLKKMKQVVGTPYYTAPEVLNGEYDRAADVWSVGVIVFCMLFGFPPFYVDQDVILGGKKEEDAIFELIQEGFTPEIRDGYGPFFPADLSVSDEARSFIAGALKHKVADRMTVGECLGHPWIRGKASDKRLPKTVFDSLINFRGTCRFKMLISNLFSSKLDPTQYAATLEVFKKWDTDGDGEISLEEFKKGMKETTDLSDDEISAIFKNLDGDDSRTITFDELVISSAFNALVSVDERMFAMFSELDKDGDGIISIDELKTVIKRQENYGKIKSMAAEIDSIIGEIDIDGDGQIDYEEFLHALHPQYNETTVIRKRARTNRGFGSFDENGFAQFQQFLQKTESKQVLEYHWNPLKLQTNFLQYKADKEEKNADLGAVEEHDDEHKYAKVETLAESPKEEQQNVETPSIFEYPERESKNLQKYDEPQPMCTGCSICVVL
eukprot:1390_1